MSEEWLVGAIDNGTTSCRMLVFDRTGQTVCSAQRRISLHSPNEGWAEHDPNDAIDAVKECMSDVARILNDKKLLHQLKCIGLAVHRESTVAFDRHTLKPLSNLILWLDTRTQNIVEEFRPHSKLLTSKTGLKPSTYFSAFKMKWIGNNIQANKNLNYATVDAWVLKHLTGSFKTDVTNASRTMLLDLSTKQYDPEILRLFGLEMDQLPTVCPSIHHYGTILEDPLKGIPITAVFGDQQASLLGMQCTQTGDIKCTLGTGAFILMNSGKEKIITEEFITTIGSDDYFALEAPIAMAASGVNWFQERFGKTSQTDSNGVMFIPALTGLLAPFWRPDVSASFHHITINSSPQNMASAVVESVAFSVALCIEILKEKCGFKIPALKVDGGLSNDGHLLQMIADVCGLKVISPEMKECTSLGAAFGAAKALDLNMDLSGFESITVQPNENEKLKRIFEDWKKLINGKISSLSKF